MTIYWGNPCSYDPDNTVQTPLQIAQRLDYLAALLVLDEAYLRFGPEKKAA